MNISDPTTLATRLRLLTKRVHSIYTRYGTPELANYAINDFSARSGSCGEQSDIAGMVHLMMNTGSDNMHGNRLLNNIYGKQNRLKSVWATEHSVALSFGPGEGEYEYIKHQLKDKTHRLKSIVADTYDYNNFVSVVMMREDVQKLINAHIGRIVLRPDSGNMLDNIIFTLNFLEKTYGVIYVKGLKVINHNIGIIQGDGMNPESIIKLYMDIINLGWSPNNLVVGSGTGIMYDGLSRDTDRHAMKPSVNIINGETINTIKDPKTDTTKRSKGGHLKVDSDYVTHTSMDYEGKMDEFHEINCIMQSYYFNGLKMWPDFEEVHNRLMQ